MSEHDDKERHTQGEIIEQRLNDAIHEIIKDVADGFVVKWLAAVEVMPEDGDRGVWSFTSPDAARWDINGLLRELELMETAHSMAHFLEDFQRGEDEDS